MRKYLWFFVVFFGLLEISAQRDSIFIFAEWDGGKVLSIQQKIIYHNAKNQDLKQIKLLNWAGAYEHKKTPLARRKLEDGHIQMHFASAEDLGKILNLKVWDKGILFSSLDERDENIYLPIFIEQGGKKELNLSYQISLPNAKFTGYGRSGDNVLLKYFFLVPDSFEDEEQSSKYFLDLEETQNIHNFLELDFSVPEGYFVQSNLVQKERFSFKGVLNTDLEVYISKNKPQNLEVSVGNFTVNVEFAYPVNLQDWSRIEFYLPLHLKFIHDKWGWLPQKILISPKKYKKEGFLGNGDIHLGNRKLALFIDTEKIDLDYFSVLAQEIVEQTFGTDKNREHWLKNGLKTYLEIQYLKKNYADHSLLGNVLDWKILGLKPLKWMNFSNLKLIDRYGAAYLYMMNDNTDQAIGTDFSQLRTTNQTAMSQFKMGALFDFVANKEGMNTFEEFLKNYVIKNQGKEVRGRDFLNQLEKRFGDSYAFIKEDIERKQRKDFRLESMKKLSGDTYQIKISKNTSLNIPFQLAVKNQEGQKIFWLDTQKNQLENIYQFQLDQPKKLIINPNYSFPESNYRNNYLEKNWFGFYKRVKFKLFTDLPNPEFNEVYLNPDLRYNAYDLLLLGLNFSNQSLFSLPFSYSFTPYISIGEWRLTGSGGISYKIQPVNAFFRKFTIGVSGAYFHYNHSLSYRKMSLFSVLDFREKPRSLVNKKLRLSYQYIDRDLPNGIDLSRIYGYYGLWNFSFHWHDRHPIHEKYVVSGYQWMRDFQKVSVDARYHWRFLPKKQADFRFFGGVFLSNNAKNRNFDYGIARINDYNFAYSLLGYSAISGVFAQEFILAEGGFKSFVGGRVNQWFVAFNVNIPVWKMFGVYADTGMYKNKATPAKSIWDSGVKVSIIPRVLDFYFPLQSSLGFEPSLRKYERRVRFSLNLDLNSVIRGIQRKKRQF